MAKAALKPDDIVVFFDLDGVLADFDVHAKAQGKFDENGKPKWDEMDYAWWTTVPPCEGAREFYDEVSARHPTRFLSAPPLSEDALAGKGRWVGDFTGRGKYAINDLILCSGKDKQFLAGPTRILIDDRIANIELWEAAGGIGILHDGNFENTRVKLDVALAQIEASKPNNIAAFTERAQRSAGGHSR